MIGAIAVINFDFQYQGGDADLRRIIGGRVSKPAANRIYAHVTKYMEEMASALEQKYKQKYEEAAQNKDEDEDGDYDMDWQKKEKID